MLNTGEIMWIFLPSKKSSVALRKTTEDAILIETWGSRINDDHYYRGAATSTYGHHTMIFSDEFLRMKRDNNKKKYGYVS
jgi:hypothetical protein